MIRSFLRHIAKPLLIALLALMALANKAAAAPGDLDPTFGTGGIVVTNFGPGSTSDDVRYDGSMALQADGKILLSGVSGGNFALARYNTNGTLDTSFDGDGKVTTDFGSGGDFGYAVAVQSDGKIVVAGSNSNQIALARYNTDGSLDTSFDGDGKLTTQAGTSFSEAYTIAVQADGKILAAGTADDALGNFIFAVVRYNTNGTLDTSFDGDGKAFAALGSGNYDLANSIAVQADGKILLAGSSFGALNDDFGVARFNTNGSLDTSFSGDGKLTTTFGTGTEIAYSVAVQADAKIVVGGLARPGSDDDFGLVRYLTDGTLDTSFDGDGKVTTSFGAFNDYAYSVAVQADGKIVAAGIASITIPNGDFALARYNTNGSLDTTFGTSGKVTTPVQAGFDTGYSLSIQSDGKFVVGGSSTGSSFDFALVRYEGTPANTAPTATVSLSPASPKTNDTLTATATKNDVDGNTVGLSYVWKVNGSVKQTTATNNLTDTFNLSVAGNGDKGQTVSVEVTPNDGTVNGTTVSANATVANTAPVATDGTLTAITGIATAGNVPTASDADGDALTYSKVGDPAQGTVTVNNTGSYSYTATGGYVGADSFTYRANDGAANSNTATINITVNEAQSLVVTTTADTTANDGVTSLREAIAYANSKVNGAQPDEITFNIPVGQQVSGVWTIQLSSGLPAISDDVKITGSGAKLLTVRGTGSNTAFSVNSSKSATISSLTITNCGSGIFNGGTLTATECAFTGNSGFNIHNFRGPSVTATNCTVSGGSAGIFVQGGNATVTNSTISGTGTGIGSSSTDGGNATITNCTISGNSTGVNNGFGAMLLKNSIVAGSSSQDSISFFNSASSYNLIGDGTSGLTNGTNGNIVGTNANKINPLLGALADNGGPTATMALLPGSPAINTGSNTLATNAGITTDQRGVTRPQQTTVDIGAFESRGFTLTKTGGDNQSANINTAFTNPLTVSVTSAFSEPVNGGVVTFAAPGSGASASLGSTSATISAGAASTTATANGTTGAYSVTASASGATAVSFSLTNANRAPVITSDGGGDNAAFNVAENSTAVTTVTATDPDTGQTKTFSVSGGADAAKFSIDGTTGVLTFNAAPNFEAPTDADTDNVYDVTVQVSDGIASDSQALTISVTNVNEAPFGSDAAIALNEDGSYTFSAADFGFSDPSDTPANTLLAVKITQLPTAGTLKLSGTNVTLNQVIAAANLGNLVFAPAPDANGTPYSTIKFAVQDNGSTANPGDQNTDQSPNTLTFNVTAVNDAPVITSDGGGDNAAFNVAENSTAVTTVTATDADTGQTKTFSISGGADAGKFSIVSSTGVLTFVTAPNFEAPTDADTDNVYNVTVQVSDGQTPALTDTQALSVTVTNANEAPVITSDGGGASGTASVPENSTAVTTVTATDPDAGQTKTFSISGGADAGKFSIVSSTGVLTFVTAPNFEVPTDADTDNVYEVTVQVSDGQTPPLTDTQALAVTVTNANDAPTITNNTGLTVMQGATSTITAAMLQAADADGDTPLTYTVTTAPTKGTLKLNGTPASTFTQADIAAGLVTYSQDGAFAPTDSFAFTVSDGNGGAVASNFAIAITAPILSGRVTNGSGVGLGGVTVQAKNRTGTTVLASAVTDSAGNYALPALPAGTYDIVAVPPAPRVTFAPALYNDQLITADRSDLNFTASFNVSGKVTTSSDAPLKGMVMALVSHLGQLLPGGTVIRSTATAADGTYSFANVPAGNYIVAPRVSSGPYFVPSFTEVVVSPSSPVANFKGAVGSDTTSPTLDLSVTPTGTAPTLSRNAQGSVSDGASGVAGVLLRLRNNSTGQYYNWTTQSFNAAGVVYSPNVLETPAPIAVNPTTGARTYALALPTPLPVGSYTVTATALDNAFRRATATANFTVAATVIAPVIRSEKPFADEEPSASRSRTDEGPSASQSRADEPSE